MSDLIPNDGSFYIAPVPEDQRIEENKEKAMVLEAVEFIKAEYQWFDDQITELDRVSSLDLERKTPIDVQVEARQLLLHIFESKKGELNAFLDKYAPKR